MRLLRIFDKLAAQFIHIIIANMAKQIKAIKCPNCGSIQKTEIKLDHYRCDNCKTEYFLDNDDININIQHHLTPNKINTIFNVSPRIKLIGASIIVAIVVFVLTAIFTNKPTTPPSKNTLNQVQHSLPPTNTVKTIDTPKKYQTNYQYCATVINDNKPYILSLEDHSYSYNDHHFFFTIYDLVENKKIKETSIDNLPTDKFGGVKWSWSDFSNNKTYFVANNISVYLLDNTNYTFSNITPTLLDNHPDYQTGIASITLSKTTSGDAFHILTNDGKKIYYYPLIDEVYVDDYDFQMVKNRPKKPAPDMNEHLSYGFANAYGENNKLIKYTFISPDGKNHIEPRSANVGDYKLNSVSRLDKHTDENSAYDLINNSNLNITITSDKNLTPGRLYFDPSIVYFDKDYLIIKSKANAAPGANYNYQQIDINDGKVIWTLSEQDVAIIEIQPYGNQFLAKQDCNLYAIINANGKIIKRIKLND